MRGRGVLIAIAVAVPISAVALCTYAWVDAGRRPVHDITISVPVPELPR